MPIMLAKKKPTPYICLMISSLAYGTALYAACIQAFRVIFGTEKNSTTDQVGIAICILLGCIEFIEKWLFDKEVLEEILHLKEDTVEPTPSQLTARRSLLSDDDRDDDRPWLFRKTWGIVNWLLYGYSFITVIKQFSDRFFLSGSGFADFREWDTREVHDYYYFGNKYLYLGLLGIYFMLVKGPFYFFSENLEALGVKDQSREYVPGATPYMGRNLEAKRMLEQGSDSEGHSHYLRTLLKWGLFIHRIIGSLDLFWEYFIPLPLTISEYVSPTTLKDTATAGFKNHGAAISLLTTLICVAIGISSLFIMLTTLLQIRLFEYDLAHENEKKIFPSIKEKTPPAPPLMIRLFGKPLLGLLTTLFPISSLLIMLDCAFPLMKLMDVHHPEYADIFNPFILIFCCFPALIDYNTRCIMSYAKMENYGVTPWRQLSWLQLDPKDIIGTNATAISEDTAEEHAKDDFVLSL